MRTIPTLNSYDQRIHNYEHIKTGALRGTSGTADSIQLHASDQSVTFPGNVTCSGTSTGFGGGKILQVVMGTLKDSFLSNSATMTDTGLGATITLMEIAG